MDTNQAVVTVLGFLSHSLENVSLSCGLRFKCSPANWCNIKKEKQTNEQQPNERMNKRTATTRELPDEAWLIAALGHAFVCLLFGCACKEKEIRK